MAPQMLPCDFQGHYFCCIVPLASFYSKILSVSILLMSLYIVCNLYTLAWAIHPSLSPFYKLMVDSKGWN
jgi:hypothetical protein